LPFVVGFLLREWIRRPAILIDDHRCHSLGYHIRIGVCPGRGETFIGVRVNVDKSRDYIMTRGIDPAPGRNIAEITDRRDSSLPDRQVQLLG
jgi:hypothetical protein